MGKFVYYQNEKITIWRRSMFSVEANSKEEADKIVENLKGENIFNISDSDNIDPLETVFLFDTTNEVSPEENDGLSTIEHCDKYGIVLSDNAVKR